VCENPNAGPDGIGVRADDAAYTLEARTTPQAVAYALQDVRGLDKKQNGKGWSDEGVSYTVDTHATQGVAHTEPAIGFDAYNNDVTGDVSKTIDTGQDYHHVPNVLQSTVRRLTPRECERLQGFPDDYTLVPHRNKPMSDGPRYKALGNSMAVPVMHWIGSRIQMIEDMSA
jgi:DNA (cytosine-5)-methyltransferase 1